MLVQLLLIILFSVVFVFFRAGLSKILHGLLYVHHEFLLWLSRIFSHSSTGQMIETVAALVLIPLFFGLLVALIFWIMQRRYHPYVMGVTWFLWVVLMVSLLAR